MSAVLDSSRLVPPLDNFNASSFVFDVVVVIVVVATSFLLLSRYRRHCLTTSFFLRNRPFVFHSVFYRALVCIRGSYLTPVFIDTRAELVQKCILVIPAPLLPRERFYTYQPLPNSLVFFTHSLCFSVVCLAVGFFYLQFYSMP